MRTRLLFMVALVLASFTFMTPHRAQAQAFTELNDGNMQRIFQDLTVYPNPFDDKVIVKYTLPYETEVAIELYNSLGQKVKEYSQSAVRQWAGTYQIMLFRPENSDAGIYFVRLSVPGVGSLTKRLMGK